jgi:hypothetical protein
MKAVDFAKILKEVIKKEVRTVIREELKSALGQIPQPSRAPRSANEMFLSNPKPKPTAPIKPMVKTGNIGLDSILAETANAIRSGQVSIIEEDSYPDMGGMFTADQAQGFGYMNQGYDSDIPAMPAVNPNDPTSVFIKDYSQVLKKAEEIHNKKP